MGILSKYTSNTLLKSYLKVFSVDVLVKASGFILLPVYLRLMTQDEYGLYGYLIAIISTFSLVLNLGIYAAQSKLYHVYPEKQRGSVLFTLNVVLLLFVVCMITVSVLFGLDQSLANALLKESINYTLYRPSIVLGVVISVYSLMLTNFFLTSEDLGKVQGFNISRVILINAMVLGVLIWVTSENDHALARIKYANITELLIIAVFSTFYIRRMKMHFDQEVAMRALRMGMPIMVSAVVGIFVNLGDRYFIEKYGTLRDMSIYNLAMTFAGIIPFVFASFQNIWLPQVLKEKDSEVNRVQSRKMVIFLTVGFVILSVAILLALKLLLVTQIIDSRYSEILPLLPIVLTTAVLTSITGMYTNQLIYLDKLYVIILVGIPTAIIGTGINIWLVPQYGIYGAALASLLVNGVILIAYSIVTQQGTARSTSANAR